MLRLRELQLTDIDFMYEWMSDPEVMRLLVIGRTLNSKEKIEDFIRNSWIDKENFHFAIVSEDNHYIGTVSLKRH